MSDISNFDELAGAKRILITLRRRRQVLLEQQAQQGIQTPPGIRLEIEGTNDEIRLQEAEVTRLKTELVTTDFSLAEATYRRVVAEQLDNENGRLTVVGSARIEELRLQLGITAERAHQLKHDVCVSLAKEACMGLRQGILGQIAQLDQPWDFKNNSEHPVRVTFRIIGRAVRLNSDTVLDFLLQTSPKWGHPVSEGFRITFFEVNYVGLDSSELQLFNSFLDHLGGLKRIEPT